MDNMKKEIERLRMELSNREGNFNRVFAKFQPVVVSPEAQKGHGNRMMMVTPSLSEGETGREKKQRSFGSMKSESFIPPKSAGSSQFSIFSTTKASKSFAHNSLEPPRLHSGSRNSNTQFRLVYTK